MRSTPLSDCGLSLWLLVWPRLCCGLSFPSLSPSQVQFQPWAAPSLHSQLLPDPPDPRLVPSPLSLVPAPRLGQIPAIRKLWAVSPSPVLALPAPLQLVLHILFPLLKLPGQSSLFFLFYLDHNLHSSLHLKCSRCMGVSCSVVSDPL